MFIKKIHLMDYKRFHDLTIDLGDDPKRIITLVGPNGCGKSSIFDALIFKISAFAGTIGNNKNPLDYTYHSLNQMQGYSQEGVGIFFHEGTFLELFQKRSKEGSVRSLLNFRSPFRYNGALRVKEVRAVSDILKNDYGASSASDIDQRNEENYRRVLAKYNNYLNENDKTTTPYAAREHIIGELNRALRNCLDLEITSIGNVEQNKGSLYFKKSDSDIVFKFDLLSSGEKEVVDLLLDLYIRKDTYTDTIYIIDEPELHLNTAIQRTLLIEINKMVPQNCQIWIATHSIGFLRALQEELKDDSQIIEFKAENKWASEAFELKPMIPSRKAWQSLFATALDDLSKLISPKIIVYCEGRAEPGVNGQEKGLDAQVYEQIFTNEFPDVAFVSSGGNTELDQRSGIAFAILSKVFPELEILVLKDRDMASGVFTTEQDRQVNMNNNPPYYRVLKRFEIENYLYDQEVLESYCAQNDIIFDSTKYNKVVNDVINDNLKDKTGAIKTCCGIVGSIGVESFKINLSKCITPTMQVYRELKDVIFSRK
ncbi:MAG: AAA family ATPase [Eubacteriales bacterium]|nr:AAA family ATPase [Eubacteriales bacterium]